MKQFNEKLYDELLPELETAYASETDPLKRLAKCLAINRRYLKDLREFVLSKPFDSQQDEIYFFKNVKPKFYSMYIYYLELYHIEDGKPYGETGCIKYYLRNELEAFKRFFTQNRFLYEYFRLQFTELDTIYFVRGAEMQNLLLPEVPELETNFSTSCDYLFAKFIAYERLCKELTAKLNGFDTAHNTGTIETPSPSVTWTGDKAALVEIIYGLFYTGQLNNGNASVADIIKWMEQHLQVDLSRAYRTFLDIKNRKRDSHTSFLDKMRESIQQRIEDENEYKPNRSVNLRGKDN